MTEHEPADPQPRYAGMEAEYQANERVWGPGEPNPAVRRALPELKPDSPVLELGAGDGRQALFLAQEGFNVTAVDIAPTGIAKLRQFAAELEVAERIQTHVADISKFDYPRSYDSIICIQTLHFLDSSDFDRVLEAMQTHTSPGGVNVVSDFTTNGPLYRPGGSTRWLEPDELRQCYADAGWEVIDAWSRTAVARATDALGNPYHQEAASIIARKPVK